MTFPIIARYVSIAAGILLTVYLMYYFSDIVSFVLIAQILAMLGRPLMNFFQQKLHFRKWQADSTVCALLTMFTFLLLVGSLFLIFVPLIMEQANNISHIDYQSVVAGLQQPINEADMWLRNKGALLPTQSLVDVIKNTLKDIFASGKVGNVFGSLFQFAGNFVFAFGSILFILFFFLKEKSLFLRAISAIVPEDQETHVRNVIYDSGTMLTRYFTGVILQVFCFFLIASMTLWMLGVKNALLLGFFAALMNIIPYIGNILGMGFAVFVTISSNLNVDFYTVTTPILVKVLIVFFISQLIDNFLTQPYIFSNRVSAHPLEIFIVILMAAKISGIGGMIIAIPAYTVIRVFARTFLSEYKFVKELTKNFDVPET
jgi:predicted PurR-regulated permease PerM